MAIVLIITKEVRNESGTVAYSRTIYISAALTLLLLCLFLSIPIRVPSNFELILLLILGFVPNILGHSILYHTIKYLPSATVASVPIGEPIIVSIFGWYLFGEIISINVVIGGFIVILGLAIIINNSKINTNEDQIVKK